MLKVELKDDFCGHVCEAKLFVYLGCQTMQLVPSKRGKGPHAMLMNTHPINGLPHLPPLPAFTLLPAVLLLTHAQRKYARSEPPQHSGAALFNR